MIDDLAQEIHGNMIVSVYMYNCYNMILAFWYDITLFFMDTFIDVFIYCFPVTKKSRKLNI